MVIAKILNKKKEKKQTNKNSEKYKIQMTKLE